MLPKNEWVKRSPNETKHNIWVYGAPFSGKTTFAATAPDLIILSTDGNYTHLEKGVPPHIDIRDSVIKMGMMNKPVPAWEGFKKAIDELAADNGNTFRTVCVDLVEDVYEYCRKYQLDKLGISHETESKLSAWDIVRTEFINEMRRLTNLPCNVILLSHLKTEKDITKRDGSNIKAIEPNLQEKVCLKLSGMVDAVFHVEDYRLVYKGKDFIFGGNRMNLKNGESIPMEWDAFVKLKGE